PGSGRPLVAPAPSGPRPGPRPAPAHLHPRSVVLGPVPLRRAFARGVHRLVLQQHGGVVCAGDHLPVQLPLVGPRTAVVDQPAAEIPTLDIHTRHWMSITGAVLRPDG